MPSDGYSACRLAKNPVKPGPSLITTSWPVLSASPAEASAAALASESSGSPRMARVRPAPGSSGKSSSASLLNGWFVATVTRQGRSSPALT